MRTFPNKFAGTCSICGNRVAKQAGLCYKEGSSWLVRHKDDECSEVEQVDPFEGYVPDEYQAQVIAALRSGAEGPHVMVKALAGSGKTVTECFSMLQVKKLFPDLAVGLVAFGKEDGVRMQAKVRECPTIKAGTTHSMGNGAVRKGYQGSRFNRWKDNQLADKICGVEDASESMRGMVMELLAKVKADAIVVDQKDEMKDLIEFYELDIPAAIAGEVIEKTNETLKVGMDIEEWGFNYDDMIYLPAILDLPLPTFDVVGIDEAQDFNRCQLLMILRLIRSGARVMAVGDPNQSLYMFRGACHDSFEQIRDALSGTDRGVLDLDMPICYRCPTSGIELAQELVPGIQARPGAPEGEVYLGYNIQTAVQEAGAGDLFLSRTNRPCVILHRHFITTGQKSYIRGGDKEAASINWLVKKLSAEHEAGKTDDVGVLVERLSDWISERRQTASAYRMVDYQGRAEVIQLLATRLNSVKELKAEVNRLFAKPSDIGDCIVISTIHRAKGSEADRVFHVEPGMVPHPKATTEKQLKQEVNAEYVAKTRHKKVYAECEGELSDAMDHLEAA